MGHVRSGQRETLRREGSSWRDQPRSGQGAPSEALKGAPPLVVPDTVAVQVPAIPAGHVVLTVPVNVVAAVAAVRQVIVVPDWVHPIQAPVDPLSVTPAGTVRRSRRSPVGEPVVALGRIVTVVPDPDMLRPRVAGA